MSAVLVSYAVALAAIVVMLVLWVGVQNAWRRTFPGVASDPDVLAVRGGCSACNCESKRDEEENS